MIVLTGEQRAAAFATDRTVAVVAGAGTGKTRVLTERYLWLVRDRGVDLQRILALTFTDKAAREMKERMRTALVGAGLHDLARRAEFAPVSTVHSFLARALRERALDVGLDPRFAVADEMTAELYLEASLHQVVDTLPEAARAALVDVSRGEDYLRELYLAARATPHEMADLRPVRADLASLRLRMARFLNACAEQTASAAGTARKLEGLAAGRDGFLALDPARADDFRELTKGGVAKAQRELFVEGKAIAAEYAALKLLEQAEASGAALHEALVALDENYAARKRADGLVDFSDLERFGLRLLRSPAGAEVACEYDHLLVDEYQDTSRIQQAILDALAERCERFGVGDEKQSIYRFRYADAAVFQELQHRSDAERYPLSGSFRSRPGLIGFTNALFRGLFTGTDVDPQDLHAARDGYDERAVPCVEILAPEADSLTAGRRDEARALARRLRALDEGTDVPFRYRDCALLLRTMTHLSVYERALSEAGVPYVVVKGRGYYAAREVVDLAHLLLVLADPFDDYRAVGVMTSLLCGVPESDLVHLPGPEPLPLRAKGARRPDAIPEERWERLRRFARDFERWQALMGDLETGDLIERILADTRCADLMLMERGGRRRWANLQKALRRARECPDDPVRFARSLLEYREREQRESEAPIAGEDSDAVKIMTVHAAKGLEFPVVAVADLTARPQGGVRVYLAPDGTFGFRLRDDLEGYDPPGLAAMKAREKEQEENERRRLLYVAMTRAAEHLILSGAVAPHGTAELLELARAAPGAAVLDPTPLLGPDPRRREGADVRAAIRRRAPLPERVARDTKRAKELARRLKTRKPPPTDETPFIAAAADLVEFERCPRRYRLKRMLGIEWDDPGEGSERADVDEHPRRLLGTAFHAIMEELGPGARPDAATVARHMPDARPRDVEKIQGWAAWLARQEVVADVADRKQHREMPFLTRIDGLAVRGVMDLYVPGDAPLLADYKTGAEVRADEYRTQMSVYLAALRALGFPAPGGAHLIYVDAEEIVPVEEAPVGELIARFREAHRDGGSYPPLPGSACKHCEFRKACEANGVAVPLWA